MREINISNNELLDLLDERLSDKGYRHPDDRRDLFLHEVYELLESEPE